jgi:putative DNA primase/helicase
VNVEGIPPELKELDQWVVWRYEERDGKRTKVPYDAKSSGSPRRARVNDPSTWAPFETACEAVADTADAGIAFVFTEDDDFAGVDADDCIDETGAPNEHARALIRALDSYTEVSPSGSGIKAIVRGSLPSAVKRPEVEMYDRGRLFTVTGRHVDGTPTTVNPAQPYLDFLHAHYAPPVVPKSAAPESPAISDAWVEIKAKAAANGEKLERLWKGDTSDYGSGSEADMALASILAFWTQDAEQLERLMWKTGLVRDKWDRHDYLPNTIEKAIETTTARWEGPQPGEKEPRQLPPPEDLAGVLDEVEAAFRRYTFMPEVAYVVLPLWAAHTHAFDRFPTTPRLHLTSPEKQCGKTRVLEVLGPLCRETIQTSSITPAVLFRAIDKWAPTLLVDEVDNVFGGRDKSERVTEILAVLNTGYRKGASALRTTGENHEPRKFATFAPVALAGIRDLPDTVADRAVRVALQRAKPGEVEPFEIGHDDEILRELGLRLASSVANVETPTERAWREGLGDREADCWAPLFSIAAAAGGEWAERAHSAARELHERRAETPIEDTGTLLLRDVVAIFAATDDDAMTPEVLRERLINLEESPWRDYSLAARGFTTRRMALLLTPYGVESVKSNGVRGYRRASVEAAGERFV